MGWLWRNNPEVAEDLERDGDIDPDRAPTSPPEEKIEAEFAEVDEAQGEGKEPPESDPHSRVRVRDELAQIVTQYPFGDPISDYGIVDRILNALIAGTAQDGLYGHADLYLRAVKRGCP